MDNDVSLLDNFVNSYTPNLDSVNKTHVWQRVNPHTNITASYGGVRLWPNPPHTVMKDITSDKIALNRMDSGKMQYVKEQGSMFVPYDVVLITYHDNDADSKLAALREIYPNAIHVKDVDGIFEAHKTAAKVAKSDMFWVVDADACVQHDFNFSYIPDAYEKEVVHVWASKNPVTGMEYGYGGVKLFNRKQVLNATSWGLDFTTGLSSRFKSMPEVSCVTRFNTDAYSTWRSAFRECVKLTLKDDAESKERLEAWLHPVPNADFRDDAKRGAEEGRTYGNKHSNNLSELVKINDYSWLQQQYNKSE